MKARNDEGESAWSTSGSARTQNRDTAEMNVPENTPAGTAVSGALPPVDSEGQTVTYSMVSDEIVGGGNGNDGQAASQAQVYGMAGALGSYGMAGASWAFAMAAAQQGNNGNNGGNFTVDPVTGEVLVNEGANLNHESTQTHVITITASHVDDEHNNNHTIVNAVFTVTVTVGDVNEPPAQLDAPSVVRNAGDPAHALDISWTAPDMTGKPAVTGYSVQYRVEGATDWIAHAVTGTDTTTTITGLTGRTTYEVQVLATNDEGDSPWSDSGSALTRDTNLNPAFPSSESGSRSLAENAVTGEAVGAPVSAVDGDGDPLTYTLSGKDASDFTIDASTGQIRVGYNVDIDYEWKRSYSVDRQRHRRRGLPRDRGQRHRRHDRRDHPDNGRGRAAGSAVRSARPGKRRPDQPVGVLEGA